MLSSIHLRNKFPRLLGFGLALCLALLATATPSWAQGKEATRVRILAVADTDAQGAAIFGLGLDGHNVSRCFEELFEKTGKKTRYTLDLYTGNQVSPLNILNYYSNLKTNASETLVFYYTGHGIAKQQEGHLITTHLGFLPRKVLLEAMKKHNPQLVVLLTDCCANYGPPPFAHHSKAGHAFSASSAGQALQLPGFLGDSLRSGERQYPSADDRTRPKPLENGKLQTPSQTPAPASSQDVLSNLFFQHRGVVDMNAAEMGKSASGNANLGGSYYTVGLVNMLRKSVKDFDRSGDGFVEWREFFPHLATATQQAAAKGGFFQTPEAFSLGEVLK